MMGRDSTYLPSKYGAFLIIALCVVSVYFSLQVEFDTRFDRMLENSGPAARNYEHFLAQFGSDESIIVALSGKPLFALESLDAMVASLELLEVAPYVSHVSGLPSVFRDRFGGEDPEALEEEMTSTPFFHGLFLSRDASIAGLLVQTETLDTAESRSEMLAGIQEALTPVKDFGFRTDLVGSPVFNVSLNRLSKSEGFRSFPIAILFSVIVLFVLLRSARAVTVVGGCGVATILLTLGAISLSGRPLNVVTSSHPPILWVLSLANCIHIVCRYQYYRLGVSSAVEAIEKALEETRFPCILSAVTTTCGFVSLMVADIGPVREFGMVMGGGMMISLLVNIILGPNLILWLNVPASRYAPSSDPTADEVSHSVFWKLSGFVIGMRKPIVAVFVVIIGLGLYSIPYVQSESNPLTFMPEESETVQSYKFVGENLTGLHSLELMIDTPGGWLDTSYWPTITALSEDFASYDTVSRVVTPLDFLKKMNQWDHDLGAEYYVLPASRDVAEDLLSLLDETDMKEIERLVGRDGNQIRMSIMVNSMASGAYSALYKHAEEALSQMPAPLAGIVTGRVARMHMMTKRLITTQVKSFGLAFVMVFLAILIGLRSFKITLVSVPPNVMPILSAFTVMALLDIPLNAATVMVTSVALGVAVDDTVHTLAGYHRNRQLGHNSRDAVRNTLVEVGPSITVTTITTSIGFFALMRSAFVPVMYFGMLSGIALIIALVADLFFVPALLVLRRSANE